MRLIWRLSLCVDITNFFLPNKKVDCVRASIFKVAKLMTHGEKVSLVVPVLASTYHGFDANKDFVVEWDAPKSDIYCLCHSFEYKGYLCRHAIVVLQMFGVFRFFLSIYCNAKQMLPRSGIPSAKHWVTCKIRSIVVRICVNEK
ncbi:hypothetical protein H5410_028144 [Solanum commersonii]|uniref:SWIM-type domain-containing protein n=1 Tax=Solanum commersonii TaxID=4109 RepID=A0A9J5Z5C5_SOLCO|nr:hypothetical protein H5410_028144 [Solanum commersonii]